jgi:DNA-binding PadR family transcriptional regulator
MDTLGDLQHLVLLAILRLDRAAYGVSIRNEIADTAGRRLTLGAIYSALRRLEAKGLIRSRRGDPEPVTGGRAKTFFDVAPEGLTAIRDTQRELGRMLDGLSGLPLSRSPSHGGES